MRVRVLTLFPEMFPGPLAHSLAGKALERGAWQLETTDLRGFATDRHRTVDDTPFGGGPGMVLRADIIDRAVAADPQPGRKIYLSPRGRRFDQPCAKALAREPALTLLCGRYEGVDERALEAHGFEELSLGDFILSGGELAAMVVLDSIVRLLPGVMGNAGTAALESFEDGLLEHPHYTRPAIFVGADGVERPVPDVLLSGHHGRIAAWRRAESERLTRARRPDLLAQPPAPDDEPGGQNEQE